MRKFLTLATSALVLFGTVGTARASSIDFLGEGKVAVVGIHSPSLGNLNARLERTCPGPHFVYAGELDWQWIGAPPNGLPASFYTYCVDVNHYLTDPQTVTVRSSSELVTTVADAGTRAAWLIDTYAPIIHSSGTGQDAAALQVAIWEAISDVTPDLAGGSFSLLNPTSAIAVEAQGYLSALMSTDYSTASALWLDAPLGAGQDQMIPLPEPASLLLLGSGLALALRRRRQKARGLAQA